MEKQIISRLTKNFEDYVHIEEEVEFWLARDLKDLLGYEQWRNFLSVIQKAKAACKNVGNEILDHFADVSKMVTLGSSSEREVQDIKLTQKMKNKLNIPQNRPMADFLPTVTIAAKNFATEITNFNTKQHDLQGEETITGEHVKNNKKMRKVLAKNNIIPEELPAEEDIKKIERKVKKDENLLADTSHQKK